MFCSSDQRGAAPARNDTQGATVRAQTLVPLACLAVRWATNPNPLGRKHTNPGREPLLGLLPPLSAGLATSQVSDVPFRPSLPLQRSHAKEKNPHGRSSEATVSRRSRAARTGPARGRRFPPAPGAGAGAVPGLRRRPLLPLGTNGSPGCRSNPAARRRLRGPARPGPAPSAGRRPRGLPARSVPWGPARLRVCAGVASPGEPPGTRFGAVRCERRTALQASNWPDWGILPLEDVTKYLAMECA